ncbi:ferritin-like domain-containing protein [Pandoraea nosoerga]|uniref:ferritin-like domain-containing protein n=1 Tax=Pandoraea nosoerga TaxID=2508296 RepID=UPI001240E5A7|nr:ferritin-like domain-containing protein [Pandoraea nosoerga]MBN4675359.1 ferritin-like domain-containing protein [Pandoraea nosoerga]MBN4680668.1 ferritin-like domain-containing protein [Pandoraea nosoerga]MBN4745854.1 ferritin-like domain-containing protein [Pandoraea nosoerga]
MADFTPAPVGCAAADAADAAGAHSPASPPPLTSSPASPSSTVGPAGPASPAAPPVPAACARALALVLLRLCDPRAKADGVTALRDAVSRGEARWNPARRFEACAKGAGNAPEGDEPGIPGRPAQPRLVSPRELKHRAVTSVPGRAALLHALAHIEFNAINLALDALWRFDGLPAAYYDDWLQVAAEEAHHFSLLAAHLQTLGDQYHYGCFPAHDGLWEMARRTSGDWLARLALVPRTLEARGLDASPPIRAKLASAGDAAGAAILDIILRDEIGHVAIGNRWYRWGCERAGLDPLETYDRLAVQYHAPRLRGPFNLAARRAAGFDEDELAALQAGEPAGE